MLMFPNVDQRLGKVCWIDESGPTKTGNINFYQNYIKRVFRDTETI